MTLLQLLTELNNRLITANVVGFWTNEQKIQAINKAGERVCNYRNWKDLELAQYTESEANREYYDYPIKFKPNSIFHLEVDGEAYDKKSWEEYLEAKKNKSESKIFATHDSFYFINPIIEEDGKEILVYGHKKWETLVNGNDESVLPQQFDEAIIKLALATCLQKERRYQEAMNEITEVEAPANPNVPNSGGILAKLAAIEQGGEKCGYVGKIKSSRWD